MKKKLYIKHKARLILTILILLSFNLGITSGYIDNDLNMNNEDNFEYIVAEYGDSIWSIVQDNYDNINKPLMTDFRDVVEFTSEINGGYDIFEGQVILIPKDIKK